MLRFLVVDDEPTICEFLAAGLLSEFVGEVTCAHTATEGARLIGTGSFDFAFIDVILPDASGLALAGLAVTENIPVLLSSGHPLESDQLEETGCQFLQKPFRLEALFRQVDEIVVNVQENIRRVKESAARMQVSTAALQDVMAASRRLLRESQPS
jgi:DNA-binding NtrC family response regulator